MRRWKLLLLLAVLALFTGTAARPFQSAAVQFKNVSVVYLFGDSVTWQADLQSKQAIEQVFLFLEPQGSGTEVIELHPDGEGHVNITLDLNSQYLRPFSQIDYRFRAVLPNGKTVESDVFRFAYDDNRFEWKLLEDERFRAHWQTGDLSFGQEILDTAQAGLARATGILPANLPLPLDIYVYADVADLQSALSLTGLSWIAGHAAPDLGVVLISAPEGPSQQLELERQLPHEIMHIVQFQLAGSAYAQLPFWFAEGLASQAELYPNPDYQRVLEEASQDDRLLPFLTICSNRPDEASSAFLAYAQSASFVRYLQQKFGSIGLLALIEHYRNGLGCAEGFQAAFELPLADAEQNWQREVLGVAVDRVALQKLSPYLLLSLVVLLPSALVMITYRRRGGENPSRGR